MAELRASTQGRTRAAESEGMSLTTRGNGVCDRALHDELKATIWPLLPLRGVDEGEEDEYGPAFRTEYRDCVAIGCGSTLCKEVP